MNLTHRPISRQFPGATVQNSLFMDRDVTRNCGKVRLEGEKSPTIIRHLAKGWICMFNLISNCDFRVHGEKQKKSAGREHSIRLLTVCLHPSFSIVGNNTKHCDEGRLVRMSGANRAEMTWK